MAITVKHSKVSTIPDGDDASVVRPSDWNDDHVLVGLGTMAEQNANAVAITGGTITGTSIPASDVTGLGTMATQNANNVAITGGSISGATVGGYIPTSEKAQPLGVATLDAAGKVPVSQIPLQGDLNYQGTWNATTNSPTLTSSVGTKGYYYVVDVAGTTNLDGITDWQVGDWAIFNGTVWQKVDNTDAVTSVNGLVGTVVLTTTNIAEGTNEYFTTARARSSISAGTGISYDSGTGVVTNSAPDQTVVLTAGTGISTSGTYPNFTVTNTAPDQVVALTGAGTTTVTGTYPNFTITSTGGSGGGDVTGPASATDNAVARFDTTTGKLIQNSTVTIDDNGNTNLNAVTFDITPATLPTAEGSLYWDSADGIKTLSLVMTGGNAVQQIGEETYYRIKASADITEGQVVMFTGSVGASGALTGAPASGLTATTASYVMGIATENIANNNWGYVTHFGLVRGINTTAFIDGDILYYDPTVAGGLTTTVPIAPNAKIQVCAVTHAASNGSYFVRPSFGGALGQYEGDVQITSPVNGQLLVRDETAGRWINATLTDGTGISITEGAGSVTVTNTAPDQTVSLTAGTGISATGTYPNFTVTNTAPDQTVALSNGTGISVTGTYPNFTITNTAPSSGGTVTSVSGTAGRITSTGGNTPVIDLASGVATAGTTGSSTLIPVVTIDTYGRVTGITTAANPQGTVTSVTGTSPVVSSGGATPAISMAAATGSVNGYLTSTDWTTFNNKGAGTVTSITAGTGLTGGTITGSGTIAIDSTVATLTGTQTLQNKTLDNTNTVTISDTLFTLQDNANATKQAQFQLSGISTGTTRTYTLPNLTGSLATIGNLAQTFSGNTTFSNATLNLGTSTAAGTYTLGNGATISGATRTINIGTAGVAGSTTAINIGGTANTSTTTLNGTVTLANALPIASGGTNSTATATAGGVGYGTGTAHAYTAAGTSGQVLKSNGSSAPTWGAAENTAVAWAQALGGTGTPLTINGSYNVSSITRTAVGKYVVNFSSALSNANYAVAASSSITQNQGIFAVPFYTAAGTISAPTTSSFPILYLGTNGAPFDVDYVNFAVFD